MNTIKGQLWLLFFSVVSISNILGQEVYKSNWTSLRKHTTPEWLINDKFGIYSHWGIQTLKYEEDKKDLSNDELIQLFKGENFNANNWAKLFKSAGARFGGVIAWHGSTFKHWNTKLSGYNTFKLGPKRDILKEVTTAMRNEGLKTVITFHSIKGDDWIDYTKEVIDTYSPDIFWVDASFGGTKAGNFKKALQASKYIGKQENFNPIFPEKYQRDFITYFYNNAIKEQKEVEFVYKSYDIPPGVAMRDIENGILNEIAYDNWMTDIDIYVAPNWDTHAWFYRKGARVRTANELVDILVDVVSKNGVFLLNAGPKSDGTFSTEVTESLKGIGEWLKVNGEAIYGTSPWFIYGEGPNEIPDSKSFHHNIHFAQFSYEKEDIRFTTKGDFLYATSLGKPEGALNIKSLNSSFKLRKGDILSIEHLGSGKQLSWEHNKTGLLLDLQGIELDEKANTFKIKLRF